MCRLRPVFADRREPFCFEVDAELFCEGDRGAGVEGFADAVVTSHADVAGRANPRLEVPLT